MVGELRAPCEVLRCGHGTVVLAILCPQFLQSLLLRLHGLATGTVELVLGDEPDLDGEQFSFLVQLVDKKIHVGVVVRQVAVQPSVPAFCVVVSPHCPFVGRPRCWWSDGAAYPGFLQVRKQLLKAVGCCCSRTLGLQLIEGRGDVFGRQVW